jgi:RES domain
MSLDIWTQCAGPNRVSPIGCKAWRVVEAQHKVMTRRLVDDLDEQNLLEQIVDEVKPPKPPGPQFARLHFLLFTPFRDPPLKGGSRFGTAAERGLWYGARLLETCVAEKAYYQILFAAGTTAKLKNLSCLWSAYQAEIKASRGIDFTSPEFAAFQGEISSPSSYASSQRLGANMRAAAVEACVYSSARCRKKGDAIALIEPAFGSPYPLRASQTWVCSLTGDGCQVAQVNVTSSEVFEFKRSDFEVGGVLPHPCMAI